MLVKLILLCLMDIVIGQNNAKSRFGIYAKSGEFPYALCIDGITRCAGVLVLPGIFITAGHCFTGFSGKDQIAIMGVVDITNITDPLYQKRRIAKYKRHDKFAPKPDHSTNYHDIAAGYLDKPFKMTATVGVAKIVSKDIGKFKSAWYNIVQNREKCRVPGWGNTYVDINKTQVRSDDLLYIWVLPWSDENCSELIRKFNPKDEVDMCGKGEVAAESVDSPGDSTLPGDSGAPLVCGEYVYGVHKSGRENYTPVINDFILFYPYFELFGIGASNQILSNKNTIIISSAIFLNF